MIALLYNGQYLVFALLLAALVLSLSCHEFGHAFVAKLCGDDTAQRTRRMTLNAIAHIDPLGLAMVILVGFGYAKPVPTALLPGTTRRSVGGHGMGGDRVPADHGRTAPMSFVVVLTSSAAPSCRDFNRNEMCPRTSVVW